MSHYAHNRARIRTVRPLGARPPELFVSPPRIHSSYGSHPVPQFALCVSAPRRLVALVASGSSLSTLPPHPKSPQFRSPKFAKTPAKSPIVKPRQRQFSLSPIRPSRARHQTLPAMGNSGGASELRGASWTVAGSTTPPSRGRRSAKVRGWCVRAKAPSPLALCRRSPRRERICRARRNCAGRHGASQI